MAARPDFPYRGLAFELLGKSKLRAELSVPVLVECMKEESSSIRVASVCALGELGSAAAAAVASLEAALRDERLEVREAAAEALGRIGSPAAASAHGLAAAFEKSLDDIEAARFRRRCIQALDRIGRFDEPVVRVLIRAAQDDDGFVRAYAARALKRVGPREWAPLLERLREEDPFKKNSLLETFARLGREAVPGLLGTLKDPFLREPACCALGRIGPEAREAIPSLEEISKGPDPRLRSTAAWALRRIREERNQEDGR